MLTNNCSSCCWWKKLTGSIVHGECRKLSEQSSVFNIHGLRDIRPGWIETRGDFYCALHQQESPDAEGRG